MTSVLASSKIAVIKIGRPTTCLNFLAADLGSCPLRDAITQTPCILLTLSLIKGSSEDFDSLFRLRNLKGRGEKASTPPCLCSEKEHLNNISSRSGRIQSKCGNALLVCSLPGANRLLGSSDSSNPIILFLCLPSVKSSCLAACLLTKQCTIPKQKVNLRSRET